MELKKVSNHPYLLTVASEDAPMSPQGAYEAESMTKASGEIMMSTEKEEERGQRGETQRLGR